MNRNKGFTLVEVAIVLVIVGFLLSTVLGGLSAQQEVAKIKEDRALLKQVKEGLLAFVAVNGYLPCPDTDNDGLENRDGNQYCSAGSGNLPHLTLSGTGNKDAYSQPLFYAVNTQSDTDEVLEMCHEASYFGRAGTYNPNDGPDLEQCSVSGQFYCAGDCSVANCAGGSCTSPAVEQISSPPYYRFLTPPLGLFTGFDGSLQVCNEDEDGGSCDGSTPESEIAARSVAAVVVAYGKNGAATRGNCNNAAVPERENCDGDRYYHLDNAARDQFDDTLIWVLPNEIKQTAIKAGRDLSVR